MSPARPGRWAALRRASLRGGQCSAVRVAFGAIGARCGLSGRAGRPAPLPRLPCAGRLEHRRAELSERVLFMAGAVGGEDCSSRGGSGLFIYEKRLKNDKRLMKQKTSLGASSPARTTQYIHCFRRLMDVRTKQPKPQSDRYRDPVAPFERALAVHFSLRRAADASLRRNARVPAEGKRFA